MSSNDSVLPVRAVQRAAGPVHADAFARRDVYGSACPFAGSDRGILRVVHDDLLFGVTKGQASLWLLLVDLGEDVGGGVHGVAEQRDERLLVRLVDIHNVIHSVSFS